MATLQQLTQLCQTHPQLSDLTIEAITTFVLLIRHMKPRISLSQSSSANTAPQSLPESVHMFLVDALRLSQEDVMTCWRCLKDIAWEAEGWVVSKADMHVLVPLYLTNGRKHSLGSKFPSWLNQILMYALAVFELYPPSRFCISSNCPRRISKNLKECTANLKEHNKTPITIFTHAWGPLPAYSTSSYCRGKPK